MAVIHQTVLKPTKLELLHAWLPTRAWYAGGPAGPELVKAGGFRVDDPAGEVGIEFAVIADVSGAGEGDERVEPVTYLVPMSYRGAPLEGAEGALIGTMEHGVLGTRYAYDACHDPVAVAELAALIEGRAQAQDQQLSDVPDRNVTAVYDGEGSLCAGLKAVEDDVDGTLLTLLPGSRIRVNRVLRPGAPAGGHGHLAGAWRTPGGARVEGAFAVVE
ncbi:1,4-alpha-glucan branching protein [Streptomyces sp. NPDC001941]|uniref:maltokinase N-terminal cap-like domain-containing protein n=1 Tax=Streptomyces sp. NPDC001941 TaxID=3154659 RepID=UPI00333093D5